MGGDNVSVLNAGLPNILGVFGKIASQFTNANGAFYATNQISLNPQGGFGNLYFSPNAFDIAFNASRSSNIYGASTTVQPPSISLIPQIKY